MMENDCDAESGEVFSNAEFYHLRNCLVELLEEVKLRRSNDAESEERIQLLVNEKYELERKYDGEQGKMVSLEEKHGRHLVDMERNFQEKTRLIEEENKQLKMSRKCGEKETDALKDSVRSLQLAKYSLEKNLRDQEHKLQSHLSSTDQQLGEITALEQKLQSMTSHFQQLTCSQDRLTKNVIEAVKLNRSLMYVNEHQKCVMAQQKADLHRCQERLVQLGTQLESRPSSSVDVEELSQKFSSLQHQMKIMKEQKMVLEKELEDYRTRHKNTLNELQETHSLVGQHLHNANQHRERCAELEHITETLKSKVKVTELLVDELHQELDVEKTLKSEALSVWTKQEELLKQNLEDVRGELMSTQKAGAVLEELNIQLTQSNVQLTEHYEEAKAVLDKEKVNMEQQTTISHFSMNSLGTQTEITSSDNSVQTVNNSANIITQTVSDTWDSSVQTDHPQCVSSMCQTIVPPLANCSSQTIRLNMIDRGVQVKGIDSELRESHICVEQDLSEPEPRQDNLIQQPVMNDASLGSRSSSGYSAPEFANPEVQTVLIKEQINTQTCEEKSSHELEALEITHQSHFAESNLSGNASASPVISALPVKEDKNVTSVYKELNAQLTIPTRGVLPVAKHVDQQSNREAGIQSKTFKLSEHDNPKKEPKISSGLPKAARSRSLYSERQLLWGAPASNEEPKEWCKKSVNSSKDAFSFVSVSETWAALISAEEQKKKKTTSGRSPRSNLKMGLRILTETSPSRPPKLVKPVISGLEGKTKSTSIKARSSRDDEVSPVDAAEGKTPNNNRPSKTVYDFDANDTSPKTQKSLKLQRHSKGQSGVQNSPSVFQIDGTFMPPSTAQAGVIQTQEKSQAKATKGILKVPWSSQKSSKSVRFGDVVSTYAQSFATLTLSVSSTSQTSQQSMLVNKASGEQLLFSDEEDDLMEVQRQYRSNPAPKRMKFSGNVD